MPDNATKKTAMSHQIPKSQFGTGAGKGDWERDIDRKKYRDNFDLINWSKNKNKSIDEYNKNNTAECSPDGLHIRP